MHSTNHNGTNNNSTILVTAIGSFSADCVISVFRKSGYNVIGCDIYPSTWIPTSEKCNRVYQAPLAIQEEKYINFLLSLIDKEKINYIVPLTDIEIDVINKHRSRFDNIIICTQSAKILSIARNKKAICEYFKDDIFIKVPHFIDARDVDSSFPLPAIAKPIHGRSSEGIKYIYSVEDLNDIKGKSDYIIEELIEGNVYCVDYVRDKMGFDFSIPREELLRTKNGAGTTVRIVPDLNLMKMASYIGNKLNVVGCINMEFIHSKDDIYYLIDINPRFSAGVAFSNFVGYNMVISHLNSFINKSIESPIIFKEQILCKYYQEKLLWKI